LEGQIGCGMEIHIFFNNYLQITGSIKDVKITDELCSIRIGTSDQEELELWEMLSLNGDVITIG